MTDNKNIDEIKSIGEDKRKKYIKKPEIEIEEQIPPTVKMTRKPRTKKTIEPKEPILITEPIVIPSPPEAIKEEPIITISPPEPVKEEPIINNNNNNARIMELEQLILKVRDDILEQVKTSKQKKIMKPKEKKEIRTLTITDTEVKDLLNSDVKPLKKVEEKQINDERLQAFLDGFKRNQI